METHSCKKGTALSTSQATGTPALKNFIIPRKKKGDGKDLLEPCSKDSRDYGLILKSLNDSRLDPGKEISVTWQCENIKLIDSEELRREFTEKRTEMRAKDRHAREMGERFCFLVTSDEKATKIYQQGLMTGNTDQHCLGNSSYGVYLHRHADVALKSASATTPTGKILIIFKVLFGKVRKVVPNLQKSSTHDPVVNYDCHVSRDPFGPRDSLSQQIIGSSVFLFDYNDKQELTSRPRQCLPYAMVSLAPVVNSTSSTPTSIAVPSLTLRPMDLVTNLKTCTVAERWGRGQNVTIKFKHFGASESPVTGCKPHGFGTSPSLKRADQPVSHGTSSKDPDRSHQNTNDPQPQFSASINVTPPAMGSIPFSEKSAPFPHFEYSHFPSHAGLTQIDQNSLLSSHHATSFQQTQSTLPMCQNNQWQQSDIPLTDVLEKVTSVVYSSRTIKDPRMLRRSTSTLHTSNSVDSEGGQQAKANTCVNESMENAEHKKILPNQENKILENETKNDAKQCHHKTSCASASLENNLVASSVGMRQAEKQPSYRMLKIKFQKYSAYLKLSKEERNAKVWSLEKLSLDDRKLLLKRIEFYENFYLKYKKGQLIRNDKETKVSPETSCKTGSQHACLNTDTREKSSSQKHKHADMQQHVRSGSLPNDSTYQHCSKLSKEISIPESLFHTAGNGHFTPSLETNTEHKFRLEKSDESLDIIHRDPETQTSTLSTSHNSIQIKRQQEVQGDGLGAVEYCARSESVITMPSIDKEAKTALCFSDATVNVDPQTPVTPEAVSQISRGDKQMTPLPASVIEERDAFIVNPEGIMQNSVHKHKVDTEEQSQDAVNCEGSKQETEERPDPYLTMMMIERSADALNAEDTLATETLEPVFYSSIDIIGACEEVHAMEISKDGETTVGPLGLSIEDHERGSSGITHDQNTEAIPLCSEVTNDERSTTRECVKDAIYSFLYERFEVSQLFISPVQNRAFSVSRKHYLKPKCINSPMDTCTTPPPDYNPNQSISDVCCNLSITIKADREYSSSAESDSLTKGCLDPELSRLTSLAEQRHDTLAGNNSITGRTPIGGALKAPATYKDGEHGENSHNLKLIKILAEKYNGKEKTSFNKMNHQMKASSIVEKATSETPQRTLRSPAPFMLREKKWCDVANKNRNSKLDGSFSTELRRSARIRNVQNNNLQSTSATPKSSSVATKQVPMKPKKRIILKLIKDFRRSNSWWTYSHKFDTNKIHYPSQLCNDPAISQEEGENPQASDELLNTNNSADEHLNTLNGELKTQNYPEHTWPAVECVDMTDTSHENGSTTDVNKSEDDPTSSKVSTYENDELLNTNNSADEHLNTLNGELKTQNYPEHTWPAIECVDMADTSHENGSTTDVNKPEDDPTSTKLSTNEVEASSGPNTVIQAEEIISVSKIIEYPLDAAIEIFCGSEVERATHIWIPQPQDEIAQDLSHTKSHRHETDATCASPDQSTTPSKKVKLISGLKRFLTKSESTVETVETQAALSDSDDENALQICDTSQSTVGDSVQLVVLDRELPTPRQLTYGPMLHYPGKSRVLDTTEIQQGDGKVGQSKITSQNTETDISQVDITSQEQGDKTTVGHENVDSIQCISPDSTSMFTQGPVDNTCTEANSGISTAVPAFGWLLNKDYVERHISADLKYNSQSTLDKNNAVKLQPQFEPGYSEAGKMKENENQRSHNVSLNTLSFQRHFNMGDISHILEAGDKAASLVQLVPLRSHCKVMLQYFIFNFERRQNVHAKQIVITRDLVLEQYLERPPVPIQLKYEALNSFLEMQMMMEAWQFIDNKMRYLSGQSTFRSLLWYDPSLYGELFKGKVGFQQQTSLYSSFQQTLTANGMSALQKYHMAVSSLNQKFQRAPNTSYYMYLKCKRERLEVEAALRNPPDIESFFLSVPLSCMINFGDTVESLERIKSLVTHFTETPAEQLEGGFDVGKAEQLAMLYRYVQEKIHYLRACTDNMLGKISWIGIEHILYDASKLLMCREGKTDTSHELFMKYSQSNSSIIYGMTESGESLLNTRWLKKTPLMAAQKLARSQRRATRNAYQGRGRGRRIERNHCAQNASKDGPIAMIDLTCPTRQTAPDDDSDKAHQSVYHQARRPYNPAVPLLPGTQQQNVNKRQAVGWGDRSHDIHETRGNISAPFSPQDAHPYPGIRACLLTKRATAPNSVTQSPAPSEGEGRKPRMKWSQSWPPNNGSQCDARNLQPTWSGGIRENGDPRAPVFSTALNEQTPPSPWSGLPSSLKLPPPMPPAGSVTHQPPTSATDHVPPERELPSINYPFFLLNGQTYATVNPTPPSPSYHNGFRFPPYHT